MRIRANQFAAVAGLTAIEAIRRPVSFLLVLSGILSIALLPLLITHTLGDAERLVRDSALATHFVVGLVLGATIACSTLQQEMRLGTASAVLSKPVPRPLFFLAKFSGTAVVMIAFSVQAGVATILAQRVLAQTYVTDWWSAAPLLLAAPLACLLAAIWNYFTRRSFPASAFSLLLVGLLCALAISGSVDYEGHGVPFGSSLSWTVVPASVLIGLAILVLSGVALSLATRLNIVPTLAICSVLLLVGLMSDYLFGLRAARSGIHAFLYSIIPNWAHFWTADALTGDGTIPWRYVAATGLYAATYLAGVLSLGLLSFRHVEVS